MIGTSDVQGQTAVDATCVKVTVTAVDVIETRCRVVADVDVDIAIVIEVQHDDAEAVAGVCRLAAARGGDVAEAAVAKVLIQSIVGGAQASRSLEHRRAFEGRKRGRLDEIELEIVRDIEVQVTVAIDITEGRGRAPGVATHCGASGYLDVALVSILE